MTGPPSAPAAGGPRRPSPKSGRPEGRTVGRHELARHPRFAEISPEAGMLDEEAMSRALAGDPSAFELLALMTTATDERLRAAAIRLSAQIVLDRARAGRPAMHGTSRLRPARGATDGDLDLDASIDGISAARSRAGRARRPDHRALGPAAYRLRGRGRPVRIDERRPAGRGGDRRRRVRAARPAGARRVVLRRDRRGDQAPGQRHRARGGGRAAAEACAATG